jgi:hypothetical protein
MARSLDWKLAAAAATGLLYLLGLISFQTHLLRFGILDLSLLQSRYLVVGAWVLVSLFPAASLIALFELRMTGRIERATYSALVIIVPMIGVLLMVWYWRFPDTAQVFDFRFYGYPRWYAVSNVLLSNGQLLLTWSLLVLGRRSGVSRNGIVWVGTVLFVMVIVMHAVLFGRTVFPALSRGIGGGAAQLARLRIDEHDMICLLIHEGADAVYVMRLQRDVPEARLRRPFDQLASDPASPIREALERNEVTVIPNGRMAYLTLYGFDQKASLSRYLDKKRHAFP